MYERHRAARYAEAERRTRTELSLSSQLLLTNLTYLLGLPIITYQMYSPSYLPIILAISAYQSYLPAGLTNNNLPIVLTILPTNLTTDLLGLCTNNCLPFCLPILLAISAYQNCVFDLLSYKHRLGSKRE